MFAASTYWANWFFMFTQQSYVDLFSDPSPVQHYWSLSIEEQFYFLLPVGMLLLLRSGGRAARAQLVVFGGAAVLSSAWMAFLYSRGASLDRLYYGTDTRLAEMLVGGCLAVALFHRGDLFARTSSRRALGVAGIGAVRAHDLDDRHDEGRRSARSIAAGSSSSRSRRALPSRAS